MNIKHITLTLCLLLPFCLSGEAGGAKSLPPKQTKADCQSPEMNGWEREELKGKVKSVRIEELQHTYGSGERELDKEITFDPEGNCLKTVDPDVVGKEYSCREPKPTYAFDASCNPTERVGLAGEWGMTKATYLYNEKGKLKEQAVYSSKDGILLWKVVYVYDDKGNAVEEVRTSQEHPEHFRPPRYDVYRTTRSTFKNDERGNVLEELSYKYDGSLFARYVRAYDAENRIIKTQRFDNEGKLEEEHTFTYDSNGNPIKEQSYSDYGWIWDALITYEYDAEGNWIKRVENTRKSEKGEKEYKPFSTTYRTIRYY
jgi:hypothetical protein